MMRNVLVVGHADADGHLITEQVRRNLALIDGFDVRVVVDPARTKDHRSWTKLGDISEIEDADFVFFVDLMFGPTTFGTEAKALVDFVRDRPEKKFFLIDHHPLPLRRLEPADNLRAIYRPDVFECALGPRSGMMVVAALCERQSDEVADIKQPLHEALAVGMKRAAAHGGTLPGGKLLALLRADRWDAILQLGNESRDHHFLPRGRRPSRRAPSDTLVALDKAAAQLLRHGIATSRELGSGRDAMAYDTEVGQARYEYDADRGMRFRNAAPRGSDLETIMTLLEVAALSLTTEPGATFTIDQLIAEAREIGGAGLSLSGRDIKIVFEKAQTSFLEKSGREFRLK